MNGMNTKLGINTKHGMNKKGGEYRAGLLIVLMLMYFTVFIVIVDSSNSIIAESSTNLSNYDYVNTLEGYNLVGGGYCANPRYEFNADTGEEKETNSPQYLACELTKGVRNRDMCNNIEGCLWDNATTNYWLWTTTGEPTCTGTINASYYGMEKNTLSKTIKIHENTEFFGQISVCNHPDVISNRSSCDDLSCTWTKDDISNVEPSYKGISSTFKEVFTFSYDFAVENETLKFFLNFLFVGIPLILMIIGIYFIIPVVH